MFPSPHHRWPSLMAALSLMTVGLVACHEEFATQPNGPEAASSQTVLAAPSAGSLTIADFIAAQGTWCTAAGGPTGCTNLFGAGGPADAMIWCDTYAGDDLCLYADLGIWERFVQEQTGQGFGSRYDGQVTERPLADGRRLVRIGLHGRNVLIAGVDLDSLMVYYADPVGIANAMIIGESAFELTHHLRPPTLGDVKLDLEIVLPTDYVGLPDLVELFFEPAAGMEMRRMQWISNAEGVTRMAFGGVPAGVPARIVTNLPWNLALGEKLPTHATATGLRYTELSPGVHISLKQAGK